MGLDSSGWGEVRWSGKSSYVHGDDVAASRKVIPYPGKDDGRQIDYIW